jgi:hypothetical protein
VKKVLGLLAVVAALGGAFWALRTAANRGAC